MAILKKYCFSYLHFFIDLKTIFFLHSYFFNSICSIKNFLKLFLY